MQIDDWRLLDRIARSPKLALGESYQAGEWRSNDLVPLLELLLRNAAPAPSGTRGGVASRKRVRESTVAPALLAARRNIEAHYDLGNDLFALFLDETLSYSCALFEHDRRVAGGRAATQAAPRLRAARARPGRPRARDRLWLGLVRAHGGRRVRRARHRGDDLARAGRSWRAVASQRPASPSGSPWSSATSASSTGRSRRSRRSRCSRRSARSSGRRSSRPATGSSHRVGARASRRSSSPTSASRATARARTGSSGTSFPAASSPRGRRFGKALGAVEPADRCRHRDRR